MNGTDQLLTVNEVCRLVGRTRQAIYDAIFNGRLAAHKISGRWLILRSEADRLLAKRYTSKTGVAFLRPARLDNCAIGQRRLTG